MVYLPAQFEETDPEALHAVLAAAPLGMLITTAADGLTANHIPFILDPRGGEHGRLLGHVARNNAVWHDHDAEQEALVVFQSADAYISPNWYETKRQTHEVVPTWNYAVVHVYGPLVVHDDARWVRGQAGMLTKRNEAQQPVPWKMADAPPDFTAAQLQLIVGIEIPISRIIGKFKASQNRNPVDAEGARLGLHERNAPGDAEMAHIMLDARRRA